MKKPTLSEIRAREQAASKTPFYDYHIDPIESTDIPYLLDLVKRMGKALGSLVPIVEAVAGDRKTREAAAEARELLKEIEK